jgi:acyl-coenzyme A thioesterase PaaI-like protein
MGSMPHQPILWSPRKLRRMLNFYPPLFFQRIKVLEVDNDFRRARVRLKRSLLTRNLNGSAFGGSIYAAADPWFPLLYWQALAQQGYAVQGWLKAGSADYKKPACSDLHFEFRLQEDHLAQAKADFAAKGKSVLVDRVDAMDQTGDVCATIECVSYLRLLAQPEATAPGF